MSTARYIFRVDDITPCMNWDKFGRLMSIFGKAGIRPLLGVIPENRDARLNDGPPSPRFWEIMRKFQKSRTADMAQHGYQHLLSSRPGAALLGTKHGLGSKTEFAGSNLEEQVSKISQGSRALLEEGIHTTYWVSPNHTYDANTLKALSICGFNAMSDGIALFPFSQEGFLFIPQQLWRPRWMPLGVITICLHPNTITEAEIHNIENFTRGSFSFTSFSSEAARYSRSNLSCLNRPFEALYVGARAIRRMRPKSSDAHAEEPDRRASSQAPGASS